MRALVLPMCAYLRPNPDNTIAQLLGLRLHALFRHPVHSATHA